MSVILLETEINAPPEVCFDLSRSIDLHMISTAESHEKAIAGCTSGLIGMNDTVTWKARHFGIWMQLTSKITAMEPPLYFSDEMVHGPFRSFCHDHHFLPEGTGTRMIDCFRFTSPLGIAGRMANLLFLESYLHKLLKERNACIRMYAEDAEKLAKIPGCSRFT